MPSPIDKTLSVPLASSSTVCAFTAFSAVPRKGVSVTEPFPNFYLSSYLHASLPLISLQSGQMTKLILWPKHSWSLVSCEDMRPGLRQDSSSSFCTDHFSLNWTENPTKALGDLASLCVPAHLCYRLIHSGSFGCYWKKTPQSAKQKLYFFLPCLFLFIFVHSDFQQCDVSKHDCCTSERSTQVPAVSDLNKHFKGYDRVEVSLL